MDNLSNAMVIVAITVLAVVISLYHAALIAGAAYSLKTLQFLVQFTVMIAPAIVFRGQTLITYIFRSIYDPFKCSTLDLLQTFGMLIGDDPLRAKFHSYEVQCEMWMDKDIVAVLLWRMTEDCKRPKIESIKDLWKYLDSVGDRGYQKFIDYLQLSLEEVSSFHLGHDSILDLVTGEKCLLESEDYKCNAEIQKIIKDNYDDFVEMTNIDELLPIMDAKQLLTSYDISLLGQKSGINKARYVLTQLIGSKGHRGYMIFLECLEEENKHHGHQTMAKKINSELKKCNICRPRKYVLREMQMWYRPTGLLNSIEYFEAFERFMYLCQANEGYKLDFEIQNFVLSHKKYPEAKAVGLLIKILSHKFRSNDEKWTNTGPKITKCIAQIKRNENRSIIMGNWYLILSCWNRHQRNFKEAEEYLNKAKNELFNLACGDDRANILYNEASLMIEGKNRLGEEEENKVLMLLQDAMRCFRPKQDGLSVMQVRCQLKKALCHIGSNLYNPRLMRRPSHLTKAKSILDMLKEHFNFMPVRLQMQYYIIECDFNRATDKKSEAIKCLRKGLNLQGGKKFQRDLTCLKIRHS